ESALESLPAHTAKIKKAARDIGREVRTLINPIIVSRETERETEEYASHIASLAAAGRGNFNYASDAHAWKGRLDPNARKARGLGGNIEIIGTPEQVIDQLLGLKAAGIDGVQIGFHDFVGDLEFFGERILPLMKEAGLRN
ncbi:MAG: LLM class flavin-dependent oxidoreductase, partial [Parvibaculaceae bacterium]|nr:LLM class flavin-dependent oxidoreductase [Parvibaculaceae bacterium]